MTPYRFALVRYIHDAAVGEFINVGVVLWPVTGRLLKCRINERYGRLSRLYGEFDGPGYRQIVRHLAARVKAVAEEWMREAPALFSEPAASDAPPLQRLLRDDASCFQWSEIMGGVHENLDARFEQLFDEFVTRHEPEEPRERRNENDIWHGVRLILQKHSLLRPNTETTISGSYFEYRFKYGWKNGIVQVLEPVSFDLMSASQLVDKANTWTGRLTNLGGNFQFTAVVAPPLGTELSPKYKDAIAILRESPHVRAIVPESEFEAFVPQIQQDMKNASSQNGQDDAGDDGVTA